MAGKSPTLPRPDVTSSAEHNYDTGQTDLSVTIARDGKEKTYTASGGSESSRAKAVVEKIISDPASAEWLPGRGK